MFGLHWYIAFVNDQICTFKVLCRLKKTHCEIFRYSLLVTEHIKLQAAKVITIKYVTSLRQNNKKPNDINLFIFNICKNMGYIN